MTDYGVKWWGLDGVQGVGEMVGVWIGEPMAVVYGRIYQRVGKFLRNVLDGVLEMV